MNKIQQSIAHDMFRSYIDTAAIAIEHYAQNLGKNPDNELAQLFACIFESKTQSKLEKSKIVTHLLSEYREASNKRCKLQCDKLQ